MSESHPHPAPAEMPSPHTPPDIPDHYEDLDAVLMTAMALFAGGVGDRRSAFHTPSVATIGADGVPSVRTVVLRNFDATARTFRFHTDRRGRKIAELEANPQIAVHVYDPRAKLQVRLFATAEIHADGTLHRDAWQATRSFSRACYRTAPMPGVTIPYGGAFDVSETGDPEAGIENFCAVRARFDRLEWLYLAAAGHRRAEFRWNGDGMTADWLVP